MDAAEFRRRGREMVDYVADYLETISSRRVLPEVKPGYLSSLLPERAPVKPQSWTSIMDDVDRAIMPGVRMHIKQRRPINYESDSFCLTVEIVFILSFLADNTVAVHFCVFLHRKVLLTICDMRLLESCVTLSSSNTVFYC